MAEFATFIAASAGGGFGAWHRRIAFGDALASGRASGLVHLEVDAGADSTLFAAFDGKITVRPPTGFLQPALDSIEGTTSDSPTLSLYLEPVINKKAPLWAAVCERIDARFRGSSNIAEKVGVISDLVYHNVDVASAKDALCTRLMTANGRRSNVCDDALWSRFLAGEATAIIVKAGDTIGHAGSLVTSAPRRVAIGLRTRFGLFDPAELYSDITAVMGPTAPADIHALLQGPLRPSGPLIDPQRSVDGVGSDRLWPWNALMQYKETNQLAWSQWRDLGDAQKAIYLKQLRARARPAAAPSGTPRFVYDIDDMANVFQLEAVVEFYANFAHPWDPNAQSVSSGQSYRTIDLLGLYGADAHASGNTVTLDDALDMDRVMPGRDTIVLDADTGRDTKQYRIVAVDRDRQVVTLDAAPQLAGGTDWRIFHNPTLVMLDAFGSRVRGARAVNVAPDVLELRELTKTQLDLLAMVNKFETIDLLDVAPNVEHAARLAAVPTLDRTAKTARVALDRPLAAGSNGSGWAIPSGLGGVQQASVDVVFQDLKKGTVSPGPQLLTPTGPASVWGFDQYDGVMFMVANGEIRCHFPWTSYTSRDLPRKRPPAGVPANYHSSIEGNAVYRYGSAFSTNHYINAGFRVIDPDGFLWTDDASPTRIGNTQHVKIAFGPDAKYDFVKGTNAYFLWPTPPRFRSTKLHFPDDAPNAGLADLYVTKDANVVPAASPAPYWIFVHPGVRRALYYFTDGLDQDCCPPEQLPTSSGAPSPGRPSGDTQWGKSGIFIHKGERTFCGSEGCQVSPAFMSLRVAMMAYDREANAQLYADPDALPRFQTELHWEQHKPALLQQFFKLDDDLTAAQEQLKQKLADPLKSIVDAVLRKKGTDAKLAELTKQIDRAKSQPDGGRDVGEGPTQQEVIDTLQKILDGAGDDDVVTLLKAEQKTRADEIELRASPLRQQCKDLGAQIEKEKASYGWNDALHGEYWVIRPDERFT